MTDSVPEPIAEIAGDCIHNLRSMLDHWVYELSMLKTGHPVYKAGFPILADKAHWNPPDCRHEDGGPFRIRELPDSVKAVIETYQPFNTDGTWRDHIREQLGILHALDIRDKHRTVNVVAAEVEMPTWTLPRSPITEPRVVAFFQGALKLNTPETLLVLDFARREDFDMNVKAYPILEVVLMEKEAERWPLKETLDGLAGRAGWVIQQMNWALSTQAE